MKIIGKTLEGDLIISVSQAEWDGLQDSKAPLLASDALLREMEYGVVYGTLEAAMGYIVRWKSVDGWLFDDFITELYKPDSAFIGMHGIGPKSLNLLRKHFSKHPLAPKADNDPTP